MKDRLTSRWQKLGTIPIILMMIALLPVAQTVRSQEPVPADLPQLRGPDVDESQQAEEPEWYQTLPPNQPGFPQAVNGAYLSYGSSPTLVDLNGDGTLEIVVGGRDLVGGSPGNGGMVYAYRHNGTLLWQRPVRAPVNSTPTTVDISGDGYPDVVVALGGLPELGPWHGGVIALNGLNGQELWTFDTQDWLNHSPDGWLDGVFSTPAIGDVNGDGQLEIAFGAWDQCIYLLSAGGQPLWGNLPGILPGQIRCGGHGFYNEDTIWSSPALADLTGNGRQEIIVGADISPGNVHGDDGGGYLYVFDADGNALAREWMDQTIFSSPAVADLDNDGDWEIVVGTGTYWSNTGYYVSAFDYDPGQTDPTLRLNLRWRQGTVGRVFASPAVADLNKDGSLDVIITVPIGENGEGGTHLYAWRGTDGAPIFQRQICNFMGQSHSTNSSPTVADVDGDQWPEILLSHAWEVAIFNHDGTYYTDYSNPQWPGGPSNPACGRIDQPTTELTYYAEYSLYASPAIGDLDGDGDAEVVIPGHNPANPNQGMIFAWTGHSVQKAPPWATWRHDEYHTGNEVFETIPPTNPTSLSSSSHTAQVWSTSNQIQVAWSGAYDEGSGLAGFSIVWDTATDTLPDTVQDLDADVTQATSPALNDGQGYYFHLRTGDRAGNWTDTALHLGPFWIDSTPPSSYASSPEVVTGSFEVSWAGNDATSGVDHYTIEVRDGDGAWTPWRENETGTSAVFQGTAGHVYAFRSIAKDEAGNVESVDAPEGDTQTAVAEYLLQGRVYDQRGKPVVGATVTTQPAALNEATSADDGAFVLGVASGGTFELIAAHPQHGTLLPMKNLAVDGDLSNLDLYLPPATNLILNGDFETADDWQAGGIVAPMPVQKFGHTGDCALEAGVLPDQPELPSPWTWAVSQTMTVPEDAREVTLDWVYRVEGDAAPDDKLLVTVEGSTSTANRTLDLGAAAWTHDWIDVTEFAGQEIVVSFRLTREADQNQVTVWLDEAGLGVKMGYQVFLPLVTRAP